MASFLENGGTVCRKLDICMDDFFVVVFCTCFSSCDNIKFLAMSSVTFLRTEIMSWIIIFWYPFSQGCKIFLGHPVAVLEISLLGFFKHPVVARGVSLLTVCCLFEVVFSLLGLSVDFSVFSLLGFCKHPVFSLLTVWFLL